MFEGNICTVCVCTHVCVCFLLRSFFWGLFLERWRNLLTGNVSGRGTVALLRQTQETRLREKEGERGPLSCDSAFHQGTGQGRHKTRHASPSSLPPSLSVPILPPSNLSTSPPPTTLIFIKKPHAGIPSTQTCAHSVTEQSVLNIVSLCKGCPCSLPRRLALRQSLPETGTHACTHILLSPLFPHCTSCHLVLFI